MRRGHGWVGLVGLLGCGGPSLDVPRATHEDVVVDIEPAAAGGAALPVFRARLRGVSLSGDLWLFRGAVSEAQARTLKKGDVPATLAARAVGLRYWDEGREVVAQPLEWLVPGELYTLASSGFGVIQALDVREGTSVTSRVFPPPGRAKRAVSVVCGVRGAFDPSLSLSPSGELAVEAGVLGRPFDGCVSLRPTASLREPAVGPPAAWGGLLEPSAWLPPLEPKSPSAIDCGRGEPLPGGCLGVEDDRVLLSAVHDDLLFVLDQPRAQLVSVALGSSAVLVRGLNPGTPVSLSGAVLFGSGDAEAFDTQLTTQAPRRHVVLNEVLSNPAGPEPHAEWIEVLNDSERSVSLSGLWLEDSGDHVPLPDVELEPFELALLVSEGFRASSADVPIPEGVRLIEVASLGARGLSNAGEALVLVGAEGVLSRFPQLAAPHAGSSMARRSADSADDDPLEFAEHAPPGASPGAPNVLAP